MAHRTKSLGIYRETTWHGLAERVTKVAVALQARGLRPGETVAIMGHACPEWPIADLAVQAAGSVSYGIHPTVAPAELALLLNHGGAQFMVAEDQEYLDRVLAVWPSCPRLEAVFVIDTRALFMYQDPLDGEVLARGPFLFAGYRGDEAATAAAFQDGWLR